MSKGPRPNAPLFDLVLNRTGLVLVFGGFGAALGWAVAVILSRTGTPLPAVSVLVGLTAALALSAIAEIGLRVQNMLEKQFPPHPEPKDVLKGDT
jgi:hypothetical protein